MRKKRVQPSLLTDAEIEQQFGERLSPTIKTEQNDDDDEPQPQIVVETESIPQTPTEKARTKLTNALTRRRNVLKEEKKL